MVYGILGILGVFASKQYAGLLFVIPYALLIEWVCSKNWMASWLLILLPPVVMVLYVKNSLKN
jgi:hypothetical protein